MQGFWWSLLATLCALHHAWTPPRPGTGPVPRYHSLLAYPGHTAALESGDLTEVDCMLRLEPVATSLTALLQGWCWSLWPAQLQAIEDWQQQAAAAAAGGAVPVAVMQHEQQACMTLPAEDGMAEAGKPQPSSKGRIAGQPSDVSDTAPVQDQQGCSCSATHDADGGSGSSWSALSSSSSACVVGELVQHHLLWPLLPGAWSGLQVPLTTTPGASRCSIEVSAGTEPGDTQAVLCPLKPTLQQLQVALEGGVLEQQRPVSDPCPDMHGLSPGLLLLVVLLSAADPPVRLAFLAGVPGEVLLRLLGEVAAGEEGAAQEGDSAGKRSAVQFNLWLVDEGGEGALGLQDKLQRAAGSWKQINTRQAVLQVLLWCFFEVAPPKQQQQDDEEEEAVAGPEATASDRDSSSSSSSSGSGGGARSSHHSAEHVQQLVTAARNGVLLEPHEGVLLGLRHRGLASGHYLHVLLSKGIVLLHTQQMWQMQPPPSHHH
jgi:hypothetical protein